MLLVVLVVDEAGNIFVVLVPRRTAREDPIAATPPATATAPASIDDLKINKIKYLSIIIIIKKLLLLYNLSRTKISDVLLKLEGLA